MRMHMLVAHILVSVLFNTEAKALEGLPVYFIENDGQLEDQVHYYMQGSGQAAFFTTGGITFSFTGQEGGEVKRWSVKLEFINVSSLTVPSGQDRQEAVFSYFRGPRENWKTGLCTFARVIYKELWPGIDLIFYGDGSRLKYDFIVKPGADLTRVRLAYRGAAGVTLSSDGVLHVETPIGGFEDDRPFAYQTLGGVRKEVPVSYAWYGDRSIHGFDVGPYDPGETLVLDPAVLFYCGYIGGIEYEEGRSIALDDQGCAYVAGFTKSTQSSFPVNLGPDLTYNGGVYGGDVFVAKVSEDGTALYYCGYIGGSNDDYGWSIDVDAQGCAYVTGETKSNHLSFPVTIGPDLTYNGGDRDAFVAKVSADGSHLEYCGYIGGKEEDDGWAVGVDDTGRACVVAHTLSTESSLPVLVGPDLTYNGIWDTFIARVSADGTHLEYCGYIGGDGNDFGHDVAMDGAGCAYIAGKTYSKASTFPVALGPDLSHNGGGTDGFVAKVSADGSKLEYCGYMGGNDFDEARGIAVDGTGSAYVTGWTQSLETTFPVLVGPDLTYNGWYWDGFVAKVSTDGLQLEYCGYIGGDADDHGEGVAVDGQGCAYITGRTNSTEATFPVKNGPDLSHNGGYSDAFVARVGADGTLLEYCGYIGGDKGDHGEDIAVDPDGNAYVVGATYSGETTFPIKRGPGLVYQGDEDAFVARVSVMTLLADTSTLSGSSGGTVNFSLEAGMDQANRAYLLLGSISGTDPGIPLPGGMATLPLNWDSMMLLVILNANTPVFQDFMGSLDSGGAGSAVLNVAPFPLAAGFAIYFAYALNCPWNFVSNPVEIQVVP